MTHRTTSVARTVGLILAGGLARRMGGEKALVPLRGKPLIQWAIERAAPQADELLINANGDPARFAKFGHDTISDSVPGYLGPLAGIMTGLEWMKQNRPQSRWLASFACDTPFFPRDLVARLTEKAEQTHALVAVAESESRMHPIFGVWSADMDETAQSVLIEGRHRKMEAFIQSLPHTTIAFEATAFDPFFNINTPADLSRAESFMANTAGLH